MGCGWDLPFTALSVNGPGEFFPVFLGEGTARVNQFEDLKHSFSGPVVLETPVPFDDREPLIQCFAILVLRGIDGGETIP